MFVQRKCKHLTEQGVEDGGLFGQTKKQNHFVLLSAPLKTTSSQLELSIKPNFYIKLATKKGLNNVKFEPSKPSKDMPRTQK